MRARGIEAIPRTCAGAGELVLRGMDVCVDEAGHEELALLEPSHIRGFEAELFEHFLLVISSGHPRDLSLRESRIRLLRWWFVGGR